MRIHITTDVSDPGNPVITQVPYTAEEEAAADAAAVPKATDYPLRPDQFFAMLAIANLTDTANAAIDAIADPTQKAIARAKFDHTPVFNRDNALVEQLSESAGLTGAQVDALWLQAKDIP